MEWLKRMSLGTTLYLVIIVALAMGNGLNQLMLFLLRTFTAHCMCQGSPAAIILNISMSFGVPLIIATIFYEIKLKTPLSQLSMATQRIKENDLNFSISFTSKDELGQLCESFESMRIALLKSHRELWQQAEERKRLNAAFAHDLRNPVTVLKGSAGILQKGMQQGSLTVDNASESIALIAEYSARIESYVEAMTSVQKLESLACAPKPVAWLTLADTLKNSLSILGASAGKAVEFVNADENRPVNVDSHMIYNVAENLVSNALRHSKTGVSVSLSCDNKKITIRITDDGSGFSAEILKKGAVPFLRDGGADTDLSRHFGMGLYICHLLCEKHGGTLTLANHLSGAEVVATFYY